MTDIHLAYCVLHPNTAHADKSDFCQECIDEGGDYENFGRCYTCRDFHDHAHCIGPPCQCPCDGPDGVRRQELVESAMKKLTMEEKRALGLC